ncbi:MAG TPA: ROK family glucokinase [Candidatus Anaerostipes excrementavium]|uniref:Glucokinase n=1 Tax=Candidatus Anaerostipes excrementavium TaxID=2838463 RepID=A0A9D2B8W0_9FIRM|nr:ROK family glucokinase [uncultured Anaerostipes sp.]HIX67361.1 ROK family glucokinase [Candidatus Anaerostipes excrementavium]
MKKLYGIDVGGTTVKMGLFSEDGELIEKWEIPTRTEENGKYILEDIAEAIKENIEKHQISKEDLAGVGVGVPGAVLDFTKVNECVNLGWGSVDVGKELSERVECPVRVSNDANVAALGELWTGAAADYKDAVMVTLGTGVGGGIIIDGHIVDGSRGYGGEIGHMTVDPTDDRVCNCGKTGCLELYASATGIVYETKKAMKNSDEATALRDLDEITAKDIFDLAKEGDAFAMKQVDQLGQKLALAFGNIALMIDPEVFVIGGGVSRAGQILLDAISKHYGTYTFGKAKEGKFLLATLGNDAGIFGAASLML